MFYHTGRRKRCQMAGFVRLKIVKSTVGTGEEIIMNGTNEGEFLPSDDSGNGGAQRSVPAMKVDEGFFYGCF